MTDAGLVVLTIVAAVGCGLVGGIFFAFSAVVMRALAGQPAPNGIATMQSINVIILNGWFLSSFFGTAAASLLLAAMALFGVGDASMALLLGGSLLYLVGCFGVTVFCNVPRNNQLAAVDTGSSDGAACWTEYVSRWTAWNTVRTVASLLAATAFAVALVVD